MSSKPRFAIIGCGKIAARHAREASKQGFLVSVCDIIPERADQLAGEYSATPYYNIQELLAGKDFDILAVCTPNGLHAEHTLTALQAGKHVLCEKPMAISSGDADKMIVAAEKAGKQLFVVKQNRFNPPVSYLKKLLEEKKLGAIFQFEMNCFWNRPPAYYKSTWKGTKKMDGGILFTQFSHFVDLLYWLLGDVASASGLRYNCTHKGIIEFEDGGIAMLQMKNGASGTLNYTVSSHQKNMEGSLTVFGEKGTVKVGGQYLNELEYFSVEGETLPSLSKGNPANQYGEYEGSMSNHDKVYASTIRSLEDPALRYITPAEAQKSIEIIEKIYAASPLLG
ncbi:MAG TPA: Gfo/Idh/MocA family oxidoreductase [Chitinophagaceae bacterium]|nr:Gfo/Idh/MocA family oxidoreductase [Chitinophagaceae bacterium]